MEERELISDKSISIRYIFTFQNRKKIELLLSLDQKTLLLINPCYKTGPDWTLLSFYKCGNCPFNENEQKFCPIAVNLVDIIKNFRNIPSTEKVTVQIEYKKRIYLKDTVISTGLSSLIGIYMVTAGCPIFAKLKPMVLTHLPFASIEETCYRVTSMYLLAQYFIFKNGENPDWAMKELVTIYKEIQSVNSHISKRLFHIAMEDSSLNALVNLDCFAKNVSAALIIDQLKELEYLFNGYLK